MSRQKRQSENAFTLVETVVVLTMASLILIAVMSVYGRMRTNSQAILDRLSQNRLQMEILQKIAEDIDRLAAPGFDATVKFQTKLDNGYYSSQLTLENSYYGDSNKKEIYEKIHWLTSYDKLDDALVLYRMHTGLNDEDKVLGTNPDEPPYIPVARGVTLFDIKAQQGENVLGAWNSDTLPKAVRVGLSFEYPQELEDGSIGVAAEDISLRTIAIDRTRRIPYQFVKKKFDMPDETDPNELLDENDPNALGTDEDDFLSDEEMDRKDNEK